KEQRVEFNDEVEWAVVNAGAHGFYRVRYDGGLFDSLRHGMQEKLSAVERFGLVNDTWAATQAGLTSLPDYLGLIELLRDENDVNVWTTVIGSTHHLYRILDDVQCVNLAQRLRDLLTPAVERLGWSAPAGESELDSQLRGDLIGDLGTLGDDPKTQDWARTLYAQYEAAADSVERNLVPALVAIVAHTGSIAEYEKFYGRFKSAQTPQEETRYLFALANFRAADTIERT